MLKYKETLVTFSEVPEEITLCINITNCPFTCEGCHSPHLREDIGDILDTKALSKLIDKNKGITCVSFMGGDREPFEVLKLCKWIKDNYSLKTCWYSGNYLGNIQIPYNYFDFIKVGPYIKERGGLNNPNTNQRFYRITKVTSNEITNISLEDLTYMFNKKSV